VAVPSIAGEDDAAPESARRGVEPGRAPAVKGAWFVTARRQIVETYGQVGLEKVVARLGEEHAEVLVDPAPSAWYSEFAFQAAIGAVADELANGNADEYAAFMEACAVAGINRFLRVALLFTNAEFLLRKMPALWARHRRNHGTLEVDIGKRRALLRYEGFPFFHDRNYRLMVVAVLRKTIELTTSRRPDVTVRDFGRDSMLVEVFYGGGSSRPPKERR
jgi:hypothetical protein